MSEKTDELVVAHTIVGLLTFSLLFFVWSTLEGPELLTATIAPSKTSGFALEWSSIISGIGVPVLATFLFVTRSVGRRVVQFVARIAAAVSARSSTVNTPANEIDADKLDEALNLISGKLTDVRARVKKLEADK